GRRGDYYTSVSVGNLFGQLLAFRFSDWVGDILNQPRPAGRCHLVEAGAHRGELAHDILSWLNCHDSELFHRLEYWIVEPSARRRQWQLERLAGFSDKVQWVASLSDLARQLNSGVSGIMLSNELLDAFPVHRFAWDATRRVWFEWGVGLEGGRFVWVQMRDSTVPSSRFPGLGPEWASPKAVGLGALCEVLPDGFTVEVSPTATRWWREAAGLLRTGKLMTIDYGFTFEERFRPERAAGTLRAYSRQQVHANVLERPGEQDITAHTDLTALQAAGEDSGLSTQMLVSQAEFLVSIAKGIWDKPDCFGAWSPEQTRQFQTLTHPEHLGRAFRVLVQGRSAGPR
ncbi:MAG TPA: SAM-dependent methyltransferase, partial [Verrucomicrobiae bacterium]|nr:SAM-dependent methyltransferase [Verrucomicrobiae bacterium]